MSISLPISSIRTDGGTQPRAALDHDMVESFVEAISAGAKFPPVEVVFDGTHYWLWDGFHRTRATYAADLEEIECNVRQGTLEDAQWLSLGANKTNGLYRSNQDKQRAIQAALKHPMSAGLSDREIARHVGVDNATVSGWRKKLEPSVEVQQIDQPATRTVTRNGKQYQMAVGTIGKAAEFSEETRPPRAVNYEDAWWRRAGRALGSIGAGTEVLEQCCSQTEKLHFAATHKNEELKDVAEILLEYAVRLEKAGRALKEAAIGAAGALMTGKEKARAGNAGLR